MPRRRAPSRATTASTATAASARRARSRPRMRRTSTVTPRRRRICHLRSRRRTGTRRDNVVPGGTSTAGSIRASSVPHIITTTACATRHPSPPDSSTGSAQTAEQHDRADDQQEDRDGHERSTGHDRDPARTGGGELSGNTVDLVPRRDQEQRATCEHATRHRQMSCFGPQRFRGQRGKRVEIDAVIWIYGIFTRDPADPHRSLARVTLRAFSTPPHLHRGHRRASRHPHDGSGACRRLPTRARTREAAPVREPLPRRPRAPPPPRKLSASISHPRNGTRSR